MSSLKQFLAGRPLTLVMAHPDDEIFLWPFLADASRIIACVSDQLNAERPAWSKRLDAFREVCAFLRVPCHNLELNSGFYRMPRLGIEAFARDLTTAINATPSTVVATHNPWGEYGHLDHILVHQVARAVAPVVYTGICQQRDWLPMPPGGAHGGGFLEFAERNQHVFSQIRAIYEKYIPWPYDIAVADECPVFAC